jgi:hypothetical protein
LRFRAPENTDAQICKRRIPERTAGVNRTAGAAGGAGGEAAQGVPSDEKRAVGGRLLSGYGAGADGAAHGYYSMSYYPPPAW